MSRIVVVGGHGRTEKLIVDRLIKNGDTVVATIRNPKHMGARGQSDRDIAASLGVSPTTASSPCDVTAAGKIA